VTADEAAREPAVILLHSPLSPARAEAVCGQVQLLLAIGGCEIVICDVSGRPDLRTVDVLARLALLTRRGNVRLVIRPCAGTSQHLELLVALTGLEVLHRLSD
jgi:hypothetical protein